MKDVNDIVVVEDNKAFTNSLIIAENTNNEHRAVLQLIKNHKSSIETFGRVAFEMRNSGNQGLGGRPTRVAILNEGQATLLMTLLRNTKKVVKFKVALVKAFLQARDLLMTSQMGLMQQHAILTLTLDGEKKLASECGRGLADWKKKRDGLQLAIERVEKQMQLTLDFCQEASNSEVCYVA